MLQKINDFKAANAAAYVGLEAMKGYTATGTVDVDRQVGGLPMLKEGDVAVLVGLDTLAMSNDKGEKVNMIRFNFVVLGSTAGECYPSICYAGRLSSHMPSAVKAKFVGKLSAVQAIADAGETIIKVTKLTSKPNAKDPDRTDYHMEYDVIGQDQAKAIYTYLV